MNELDQEKLPTLLDLKYHAVDDAILELGEIPDITNLFIDFQQHLYEGQSVQT